MHDQMAETSRNEHPCVSVIIPALNEEATISKCIDAILASDYPQKLLQIIVVDNGSTDGTSFVASRYPIRLLHCQTQGVSHARNLGARNAAHNILAFIDADCLIGPTALKIATRLLDSHYIGACGGSAHAPSNSNWIQSTWAAKRKSKPGPTNNLSTAAFYVRADVFSHIGGFNEYLPAGEDTDLSRRLRSQYTLQKHPELDVLHLGYPVTLSGFFQRQLWQSSRYLQSKKYGIDYTLIATSAFLFSFTSALIFALLDRPFLFFFFLTILPILSASLSLYRIAKAQAPVSWRSITQSAILNSVYLVARSCGLTISIAAAASNALKKPLKRHTP